MFQSKTTLFRFAMCLTAALTASLALAQKYAIATSVRSGGDEFVYMRVYENGRNITANALAAIMVGHCSGYKCARNNPADRRGEVGRHRVYPMLIGGQIRIQLNYTPGSAIQFYNPDNGRNEFLATWN